MKFHFDPRTWALPLSIDVFDYSTVSNGQTVRHLILTLGVLCFELNWEIREEEST